MLFLASVGCAAAADSGCMTPNDRLTLSRAQELALFESISRQGVKKETAPSGYEAEIGHAIPKSITLHKLPRDATRQVPTAKSYEYAMLQNQLLIVNPHDRIAVDAIPGDVASNLQ
jgi:hypothetical protein